MFVFVISPKLILLFVADGTPITIVIDGNGLVFHLYREAHADWICGGQYHELRNPCICCTLCFVVTRDRYAQALEAFFLAFIKCGINLVVFFDGAIFFVCLRQCSQPLKRAQACRTQLSDQQTSSDLRNPRNECVVLFVSFCVCVLLRLTRNVFFVFFRCALLCVGCCNSNRSAS